MTDPHDPELLTGLREEVAGFWPDVEASLAAFRADPSAPDVLEPAFRHLHTLTGASGLVGLTDVSATAAEAEELIHRLMTGGMAPDDEVLAFVDHLTAEAKSACDHRTAPDSPAGDAAEPSAELPPDRADYRPDPTDQEPDALTEFIREMDDHVPVVAASLGEYNADPARTEALEEAYRRLHALKGPASLLGLDDLYHLLFLAADVALDLAGGLYPMDASIAALCAEFTASLDVYRTTLRDGRHDAPPEFAGLTDRFRLLRRGSDLADEAGPFFPASADDLPDDPLPDADDLMPEFPADPFPPPLADHSPDFSPEYTAIPSDASHSPTPVRSSAGEVDPEILEVFLAEADEHLRELADHLPAFGRDPSNRESLVRVRRTAHTLKGSAAMVGLADLARLAHRMEDLLDGFAAGDMSPTPDSIGLLLRAADGLEDLARGRTTAAGLAGLFAEFDSAPSPTPTDVDPGLTLTDPVARPGPVVPVADGATTANLDPQMLRVRVGKIDDLLGILGEVLLTRTSFDQQLANFRRLWEELRLGADRLRQVAGRIETGLEVRTLARTRLGGSGMGFAAPDTPNAADGFDELEFDRYTEFHLLTRSLAESSLDVQTIGDEFGRIGRELDGLVGLQARLTGEMEDKLRRLRMVPVRTITGRLARAVRNAAEQTGNAVDFRSAGDETEVDRAVLDELADPLMHLVRNAADHGIESASERAVAGKPAVGRITLTARQVGGEVVLTVADDGRGIDPDRVRQTAVAREILSAEQAERLGTSGVYDLLFRPGFSTAKLVTELSGRGVGLDVVAAGIRRLNGHVSIASEPGRGTTFTLRLPLTLTVSRIFLVTANQQTFGFPLAAVDRIVRLDEANQDTVAGRPVVRVGDAVYPLVDLASSLALGGSPEDVGRPPLLLLRVPGSTIAVRIDRLLGGREVVVKRLTGPLRATRGVIGATLTGDGKVVLVLSPADLVRGVGAADLPKLARQGSATGERKAPAHTDPIRVLIVDDSPSVRRVVASILRTAGYIPLAAKDGVEALETLHQLVPTPDVVLLDVEMPRMDGYELLRTLRSDHGFASLPVVMCTSRGSAKHRAKALELGATDYLVKPFRDDDLVRLVESLARGRSAQARPSPNAVVGVG